MLKDSWYKLETMTRKYIIFWVGFISIPSLLICLIIYSGIDFLWLIQIFVGGYIVSKTGFLIDEFKDNIRHSYYIMAGFTMLLQIIVWALILFLIFGLIYMILVGIHG